eukprot:CAMPEP_0176024680 /NCGR_PEP_ID=MMETSP0120_2-20121206/12063_1 /TAXON_ID=160619 /ORGANISM="Kryptoperidinium foliaceum, Strain CCMP 1326" /LENGTH=193 /DNA_ID=CAMNT_0017357859 /DNA_START=60 /DNA_END=641 /DNA_ORIENTATION=-
MSAQMIASSSRNAARSACKLMGNDSLAFYPSASNGVKKTAGGAFAFYPSAGAKRIPVSQQTTTKTIPKPQEKPTAATLNYSRSDLDALFAQSRQVAVNRNNVTLKNTSDSMAFHAVKNNQAKSTIQSSKKGSFAYYPSQGAARNIKNTKSNNASSKSTNSAQADNNNNNMSIFAAGSLAMGMFVQAGRAFARP